MGRLAEALSELRSLRNDDPTDIETALELAQALILAGESAAALDLFDQVLAAEPARRPAWVGRLRILLKAEDHQAALDTATRALSGWPDDSWLRLKQGALLRILDRPAEAVAALASLHRDRPEDLNVRLELGYALEASGEHAAAQAMFEAVLAADPSQMKAWRARATAALQRGDQAALPELARRLHDRAAREPDPQAIALLARIIPALDIALWNAEVVAWIEAVAGLPAAARPADLRSLYVIAQLHGLTASGQRLLSALLDRPLLPLPIALDLLRMPWGDGQARIRAQLRGRLAEADGPLFDLHAMALDAGPGAALARRPRLSRRPVPQIILLADLLADAGRRPVAQRYLAFIRRLMPDDPLLRRRHVTALIAMGEAEAALCEAEQLIAAPSSAADQRAGIGTLVALGQPGRALALMERITDPGQRRALRSIRLELMLRFGRAEEARKLAAEGAILANARRAVHFGATQLGQQIAETDLATWQGAAPAPSARDARLIGPGIAALDAHLARRTARPPAPGQGQGQGQGRIPRHIVQYWNTGRPPAPLADIMRSWREARGYAYHLFDRLGALRFLAAELGADWAAALRLAQHPAEQSDFFRLCFLAVRGGIYADCDDRLVGLLDAFTAGESGLVVFQERHGAIANNLILAEPAHPVIIHAAVAAKQALLRRDNDSVWAKTGPGLLTRSVAWGCEEASARGEDPGVTIHPLHHAARYVECHIPLPYKQTADYWNASSRGSQLMERLAAVPAPEAAPRPGPP